jgi:hypothetical protein
MNEVAVTEPVTMSEPVICAEPVNGKLDAPATYEAVKANDDVPCNEPVIPAVTESDPVISELPCERYPFLIMNSFGISFPYPRLCLYTYKYG